MLRVAATGVLRGLTANARAVLAGPVTAAYSSSEPMEELTMQRYSHVAEETLHQLTEQLDELGEMVSVEDYDVLYANGVITLKVGKHGTFVINKQPPNKQIWLSSPISGPKRFDYVPKTGTWWYRHKNEDLVELLNTELSRMMGRPVTLNVSVDD